MGGGLMQLVAYGAQDIYLTGNPQITFFKVVYRRHTNFSMEAIDQTLDGTGSLGGSQSATISRNGDLISKMYVEFVPSEIFTADFDGGETDHNCAANLGNTLLKEIELEIGGQRIDKHYNHWLNVWSELTEHNPAGTATAYTVSGQEPAANGATLAQRLSYNHQAQTNLNTWSITTPSKAFIPLQFWFCRNPGLALPLIALQYHEVKIKISYCSSTDLVVDNDLSAVSFTPSFSNLKLWVDYIYLDTDERRRFAQQSHEYLIEQLQYQTGSGSASSFELNFNHPVKELIWTGVGEFIDTITAQARGPIVPTSVNQGVGASVAGTATTFKIVLNGHDRISPRNLNYFTRTQVWQHHTGFGGVMNPDSIYVYSFALKPEEHQPSGTCNFSRIDNARIESDAAVGSLGLRFYAINYNVLRIMSGMGGLAYSN
jgi:hypothetical protein